MKAVDKFKQEKKTLEKISKMAIFNYPYSINPLYYDHDKERIYEKITENFIQKTYTAKDVQESLDCLLKNDSISTEASFFISYMINNTKEQEITIDTHNIDADFLGYKAKNKTLIFNSKLGWGSCSAAENCIIIFNEEVKGMGCYNDPNPPSMKNCVVIINKIIPYSYDFYGKHLLENGMITYNDNNNNITVYKTKQCDEIKELIPQIIKLNNSYFSAEKNKLILVNKLQAIEVLKNKNKLSELEEKLMEDIIGTKENACPECKKERPKISKKYAICEN